MFYNAAICVTILSDSPEERRSEADRAAAILQGEFADAVVDDVMETWALISVTLGAADEAEARAEASRAASLLQGEFADATEGSVTEVS